MNKVIKFFKENYKKDRSIFDLAIKFHKTFLDDECYIYDDCFRVCLLYIMCNLDIIHINKEDFRIFTNEEIFERIAQAIYRQSSFYKQKSIF